MSLNKSESTTLATSGQQKKQLKIAKPFEPPKISQPEPIQNNKPYYPPQSNQTFYQTPQQQYPPQQQPYYGNPQAFPQYPTNQQGPYQMINQSYNNQLPLRDIQIDVAQVQQPQIQTDKPKEKKKLKIATTPFEVQGKLQDKLQEVKEEIKKKEEQKLLEEQKKKEQEKLLKQPKPYSKEEIDRFLTTFNAQDYKIFSEELWETLANRKYREMKEFTYRGQGERKSTNTQQNSNNSKNQKRHNTQQQQEQKVEQRTFERGTNIAEETAKPNEIRVGRQIEDNSVKFKREQLKAQTGWVEDVQTKDLNVQIEREIKFKLNQLAPDNFNTISKTIIEYLVSNHELAEYIAQRIIEKSQLEPKYRFLYTKLCAYLVNDPRLQITAEQQAKDDKLKKGSIFKKALLNGVQDIFEGRVKKLKEDQLRIAPDQKESFHIQRKNKIMGNVRFIGDLYLQKILPQLAVQVAIRELLQEFLSSYLPDGDNLEESLEGLIELLDQIGPQYKVQQPIDAKQQMQEFFNGQAIDKVQLGKFCSNQFSKFIPLDNIFQIFDILKANYKLSSRLIILYENLLDRKRNGWKEIIHQKGENAKSVKQLQDEYEKEQDRLSSSSRSHGGKRQSQQQSRYEQVQYVTKESQKNGKQYQDQQSPVQQQPEVDLVELAQYVTLTFKSEGDEQTDKLKDEIKRHNNNEEAQTVIFESFFTQMLKPSKAHLEKSQIVYELLSLQESNSNSIKKGLNKVFSNEDYLYDLVEAPIGVDLFVDIIFYFINEKDLKNLEKLQIKPAIYVEEYYNFLAKVMSELEEKFPDTDIKQILNSYLKQINITEIIVE